MHRFILAAAAAAAFAFCTGPLAAQDVAFGERLFQEKGDCQFCHGPKGDGHGDPRSPGKAADLHVTILNREQLIEVIACGRPGTEMPYFDRYAYEDTKCYGMLAADIGKDKPPVPHSTPLAKREIEAVADFILVKFKGK